MHSPCRARGAALTLRCVAESLILTEDEASGERRALPPPSRGVRRIFPLAHCALTDKLAQRRGFWRDHLFWLPPPSSTKPPL